MSIPGFSQSSKSFRQALGRDAEPPVPFIVGSPRSGTTLLRLMLDSHPLVAIPPETGFIPTLIRPVRGDDQRRRRVFVETMVNFPPAAPGWEDFGIARSDLACALRSLEPFKSEDALRCFYRLYAARFGKIRWGDKTPAYGRHMRRIQRALPEARFIHIIRDGRDAALSLRGLWFAPGRDMRTLARHWRDDVEAIRREAMGCRYLEVRYEALIQDTQTTLKRLCEFLELDYAPAMLAYHIRAPARLAEHRGRVTRDGSILVSQERRFDQQRLVTAPPDASRVFNWRGALRDGERADFEAVAGKLLKSLDYPDK